jgi:hypothetical protein
VSLPPLERWLVPLPLERRLVPLLGLRHHKLPANQSPLPQPPL